MTFVQVAKGQVQVHVVLLKTMKNKKVNVNVRNKKKTFLKFCQLSDKIKISIKNILMNKYMHGNKGVCPFLCYPWCWCTCQGSCSHVC